MKKQHFIFLLATLAFGGLSAQTLEEAQAFYNKGNYEKAKPIFAKYIKTNPANGNYNLWYGVCCLKTGETSEAVKYLESAVKKRVSEGKPYLAEAYNETYRFNDAVSSYEEYISELDKRKKPTNDLVPQLEKSKNNLRMLKGVEQVCIIDSFVIDKKRFLEAYKISSESGKVMMYDEYFQTNSGRQATVYETEIGNKIYYGDKQANGKLSIFSRNKLDGEWSKPNPLPDVINGAGNANYPYVLTDGLTIYYAADGKESIGGYDIFVTRYNTDTDSYLTPENVGMPFNSPYNDYMFVIDEFNNLGWFASDRYQPEDKVCIYVFIPNATKKVYNYEETDPQRLIRLAQIHSIKDTWKDKNEVNEAKKRMQNIDNERPQSERTYDFEFIINDRLTYHQQSDFHSPQAKSLFNKYRQAAKELEQQQTELNKLRETYATAGEGKKTELTPLILKLEKQIDQLVEETKKLTIEARNTEVQTLK